MSLISVIIPTFNEEKTIEKLLLSLIKEENVEIIVVDGKSTDRTVKIVKKYPVKFFETSKNRAQQMNLGAKESNSAVLLFLHSDCTLEPGWQNTVKRALGESYIGGCFKQKIIKNNKIYRLIESSGNIRASVSKVFYGDQAIFVMRDVFLKIGGYDKVELFDDVIFSKKMKKLGKTCVLDKRVYTYSRRWEAQGLIRTTFINWLISIGFICGVSPKILKRVYFDFR